VLQLNPVNTTKAPISLEIVRADATAAAAICKVGRQSFHDAFEHLFNDKDALQSYLDYTYSIWKLQASIAKPNNSFYLAYAGNEPVGFAKMKKLSMNHHLQEPAQSELQKIYVLREYHGSGAGQQLMDALISESKKTGTEILWLDVHVSNHKARRFYEKNGFSRIGDHSFIIGSQTFYYDVMALRKDFST
jgi:diamine N-acetyltransferase